MTKRKRKSKKEIYTGIIPVNLPLPLAKKLHKVAEACGTTIEIVCAVLLCADLLRSSSETEVKS